MIARKATPEQPALLTRPLVLEALATEEPMLLIGPHGSPKSILRVIEELVQNCLDAEQEYLMDSEVDARAAGLYGNQCCESGCCIGELHEPGK